jgi:uncharacterized membrane protein
MSSATVAEGVEATAGIGSAPGPTSMSRLTSVDMLRGLVMIVMAIDHTRDFVHSAAMNFPPEDLARTTPAIFLTRWITHICAPAFMFCAGLGAGLRLERGGSVGDLSRFLWTRGLWLVFLELSFSRLKRSRHDWWLSYL